MIEMISNRKSHMTIYTLKIKVDGCKNYSCIEESKLKLTSLNMIANKNVLFECILEIYSPVKQEIELAIIVSNYSIIKVKREVSVGLNQISVNKEFISNISGEAEVFIVINSLEKKELILQACTLNVWGLHIDEFKNKYDSIEMDDYILLSFLKDNKIYYKIITNNAVELNEVDFDFCGQAKDYSFVYDDVNKVIYLARIDLDGNVFLDNFKTHKSLYIDNYSSCVSAAISNEKIIVCYAKNKKCHLAEIEKQQIKNCNKINYDYITKECSIFYNKYSNHFYIILKLNNGKNILIEELKSKQDISEKLVVSYDVYVDVYEVNNAG